MSDKVNVNVDQLIELMTVAMKNGTQDAMLRMCADWARQADAEIDRRGAELKTKQGELLTLAAQVGAMKREVADADEFAGRTMRRAEALEEENRKTTTWFAETKEKLGYDRNVSFDVVWREISQSLEKMTNLASVALAATRERRALAGHHDIRFRDASGQETIGLYQNEYDELEKARRLVEGMKK